MNLGDYEKQVQKATQEPTQAISYGKGRLSQKAEPRATTEVPRATENNGSGPHWAASCSQKRRTRPHVPGRIPELSEPMPAMCLPSGSFLNGSIYYHCPIPVSHCLSNMCRACNLSHLQVSGSRGATAKELPPHHLELTEITGSGPLNLMLQLNETYGGPRREGIYFIYERRINNWNCGEGCGLLSWSWPPVIHIFREPLPTMTLGLAM